MKKSFASIKLKDFNGYMYKYIKSKDAGVLKMKRSYKKENLATMDR